MTEHSVNAESNDPCGASGPTQRWAYVWFLGVLLVGIPLTLQLASIDRWMYDNNGEVLDYQAYRENRTAQTNLRSESIDDRQNGELSAAEAKLRDEDQ
jgi:hypothetical protein